MKILFHSNQLSVRGTEVALYDYALYNEILLKNESVIITPSNANHSPLAKEKFESKFKVLYYNDLEALQSLAENENAQLFYAIKAGQNDGIFIKGMKNAMHVVFNNYDPHGDVYAYVSEWLSQIASGGKAPFVPHMVSLPDTDDNLRTALNIPDNAVVIGRHGGDTTFDIKFAKKAVVKAVKKRNDLYFLFLGTQEFGKNWFGRIHKRIIFLPSTTDLVYKTRFINTCDAMLHARRQGESFGLAVGEFSIRNKPVMTWTGSNEKSHISILGESGIYYRNKKELLNILMNFKPEPGKNWDRYSETFNPESVMRKFHEVFIQAKGT